MKQIMRVILCVFLCLMIVACNDSANADLNGGYEDSASSNANGMVGEEKDSASSSDNTAKDSDNDLLASPDYEGAPPVIISFSSIVEINTFLRASSSSPAQYDQYLDSKRLAIPQKDAQNIASNIQKQPLPNIKTNTILDGFGATYYMDREELDLIYRINNTRYRFVYSFNWNQEHHIYEGVPLIKKAVIGSYAIDFYRGDECLVGSFLCGDAMVRVIIESENTENIAFDLFEFDLITTNVSIK